MLRVSQYFKTSLEVINICSSQSNSMLAGSEEYWGNSDPGCLFKRLVYGDIANPVLMLDELDKARSDGVYNPLSALHQLLEPEQAALFHDLSVPELQVDASYVLWIATANDISAIEKPIVDRFAKFNIAIPTREQMSVIAKNQYVRFRQKEANGFFDADIKADVLDYLCQFHPRKVRKIMEVALGRAAYFERSYLTIEDIEQSDSDKEVNQRGIGFLAMNI